MRFSRHEYWSGLPFPTTKDLPDSGSESASLTSPALTGRFFTTEPPRKPLSVSQAGSIPPDPAPHQGAI